MRGQGRSMWRCMVLVCASWMLTLSGLDDVVAAELRKCTLANGRVAYVSDACPSGSRQIWQRPVDADPQHEAALKRRQDDIAQWQQASRRESALRLRPASVRMSARNGEATSSSRCERARQRRDRIRDKEWMRMTYDRMTQLDDEVADACR